MSKLAQDVARYAIIADKAEAMEMEDRERLSNLGFDLEGEKDTMSKSVKIKANRNNALTKYIWIRAWGVFLSSNYEYIARQCEMAEYDKAPTNAYRYDESKKAWKTIDEITNKDVRRRLSEIAGKELPESAEFAVNYIVDLRVSIQQTEESLRNLKAECNSLQRSLSSEQRMALIKRLEEQGGRIAV